MFWEIMRYPYKWQIAFPIYRLYNTASEIPLSENGVFTQHDTAGLADNNYNDPVNRYFLKDDGTPGFECRPQKYLFTGATEDLLIYARSETNCAAQKALRRRRTESRY